MRLSDLAQVDDDSEVTGFALDHRLEGVALALRRIDELLGPADRQVGPELREAAQGQPDDGEDRDVIDDKLHKQT